MIVLCIWQEDLKSLSLVNFRPYLIISDGSAEYSILTNIGTRIDHKQTTINNERSVRYVLINFRGELTVPRRRW